MPAVKEKHFTGGTAVVVPDKDGVELAAMLRAAVDDITALRAGYAALLVDVTAITAKLDDDAGVTDTNYEAGITATALAAQALTKA